MSEKQQGAVWCPTGPVEDVDDPTLRSSPIYESIKKAAIYTDPNGKVRSLPQEVLDSMARDAWRESWDEIQRSRHSNVVLAVFEANGDEDVDKLIIHRRRNEDGSYTGIIKQFKKPGTRKRMTHADYARLIGFGDPPESEMGKLAKHGGFVIKKTAMKNDNKNGVYELVIKPGIEGNEVCDSFVAELYQYPDDGAKTRVIVFPPKSGQKKGEGALIINDDIEEVPSMSKMLQQSLLKSAMTPAVVFKLNEYLKNLPDDEDEDIEDEDEQNIEADEVAKLMNSLDSDDDDEDEDEE